MPSAAFSLRSPKYTSTRRTTSAKFPLTSTLLPGPPRSTNDSAVGENVCTVPLASALRLPTVAVIVQFPAWPANTRPRVPEKQLILRPICVTLLKEEPTPWLQ